MSMVTGQCVDLAGSGALGAWECGVAQPNQRFAVVRVARAIATRTALRMLRQFPFPIEPLLTSGAALVALLCRRRRWCGGGTAWCMIQDEKLGIVMSGAAGYGEEAGFAGECASTPVSPDAYL